MDPNAAEVGPESAFHRPANRVRQRLSAAARALDSVFDFRAGFTPFGPFLALYDTFRLGLFFLLLPLKPGLRLLLFFLPLKPGLRLFLLLALKLGFLANSLCFG